MKMKAVHFQIDNTTALMYLLKMGGGGGGGYWEQEAFGPGQGYMGLYHEEWDQQNICRISAKLPKRGSRLAVKEHQG